MHNTYEAPELKFVGEATEIVMGPGGMNVEGFGESGLDFEFEQDEL